ncbi:MAG: hypothetical protein E6I29_00640 [Chloroflexi bacterium]|nr:MAG: hypothetical protein E6I29_00640 [Chloroflexota bacterium]
MRLAALDMGSNTVHVLVADVVRGRLEEVAHYVEMPALGPQVARNGVIGSRAAYALRAVRKVMEQARSHGYDELLACATQAIRQASDGPAFVRQASEVLGVPVRVISGRREAALSFLGAAEMLRSAALPIGSGVLADTYLSDPPRPEERARLRKAALRELPHAPDGEVERLVATGGTASNLPTVLTRRNPPAVLTTADLLTCETRLDRHRARHVAALVGLPPNRVKAMRGGVEALLLLLDWYGLALLHVSHEGLRHGMLLAYLERGRDWWRDSPREIT